MTPKFKGRPVNELGLRLSDKLKVTVMIPCFNEEATIRRGVMSILDQTRPADQILIVNDSSTDKTAEILARFGDKITVIKTPKNFGNKSHAQEYGLKFVTGDIVIASDGDTLIDPHFIEEIIQEFNDPKVAAAGGYVKSMKNNWLTRSRAYDYTIGQNINKLAQSYLGYMFVIPGAAGAFRTHIFRDYLSFDHDTITEDLDFTYKLHKQGLKVNYNRDAIVLTQDPATLYSYINQMRRWFGGGWQNLAKHYDIAFRPRQALELSLMYVEGLVFSMLLFIVPLIDIRFAIFFFIPYLGVMTAFSVYAAIKEKRWDFLLVPIPSFFLMYVNSYIFLEQFVKEIIFKKKNLVWFKPERTKI
jgi:cellulose synthase/poly-beta-1,6-N-acetylglucosamine synthase-like glycosyltransferase